MTEVSTNWYVVQTHPRGERKAEDHLKRQGFDVYLPRYLKKRRHARRVDNVPAPLFPRYLFVAVDMAAQRWRSIRSTHGVSQLVCNGELPSALDVSIVDGLKRREDDLGYINLPEAPRMQPGDRVRVLDGVFTSSFGLCLEMKDNERVAILLELLGRKVRVFLDAHMVVAA